MNSPGQLWIERIKEITPPHRVRIMNVCGGHERTITMAGLRAVLPQNIELIPGPGCPVCVCPEEDIYTAITLAQQQDIILATFGDMLRVPVNVPKSHARSLEQARASGAEIIPVASPLEVVALAQQQPSRQIVFFAAGFETTMAPLAAMLAEGVPENLSLLLSGRKTWPAVEKLLTLSDDSCDALIAPGHVSAVMGADEWHFVVERFHTPVAVAGFTPLSMLAAIQSVLKQIINKQALLDNCYAEVVRPDGNEHAKHLLNRVMQIDDANWRGIGIIPASGFSLKPAYAHHDARLRFQTLATQTRPRVGEMPPGCDCAKVLLGQCQPNACQLYGKACTPQSPIGPCMVSDEGACRIWWNGGIRHHARVATA